MTTKTCDNCAHYTPPEPVEGLSPKVAAEYGDCAMTLYSNDGTPHADRAYGWDAESYHAGVHVGPKFGGIHWMKKGKK